MSLRWRPPAVMRDEERRDRATPGCTKFPVGRLTLSLRQWLPGQKPPQGLL